MESSVQAEPKLTGGDYRSSITTQGGDRIGTLLREMEYLNTIGKRFVAANNRFQVHHALLAALQEQYSFAACAILLKDNPLQLSIIPAYPLSTAFIAAMIGRIASAAHVIDFPHVTSEELAEAAYLDAPEELIPPVSVEAVGGSEIGSCLNIPMTVEDRIIGLLSLFDTHVGTFDTERLRFTSIIADYAAIALENVRLRESERALWRQAEEERQRLELIISSMAEGLLITDASGAITSLNQSAQHLLSQAHVDLKQDIPLRKLAASSKASWLSQLAEIVDKALANQVVMNQELIAGESSQGVPLTLSISAAPLHNAGEEQKRPTGVVAVLNDVTSHKQIERLKDEFVSVVSHELRTPLTAIKGYTQHLVRRLERRLRTARQGQAQAQTKAQAAKKPQEQSLPAPEPPESYDLRSLYIVQSQAEHLERLVSDLLDLSRVQWGHLELHPNTFFLADLLTESVRSVQASAEQHTISLDINVDDSRIVADRQRVSQVVGNILDNAVKYSPHGGQVMVSLQEQDGDFLVSISDQGIGISPEYLDHIFERFYRVHNTASHQYSGIGLGLYVARAIVERHGGRIWFSNNPGIGSTFYFTLPHTARTEE
jgi:PAS domain S-box-containing protein